MALDPKSVDEARQTLGLDHYATLNEIRSAYKKLAAEWHPDRHAGADKASAEARFQAISHAHDVLTEYCARYLYSFKEEDIKRTLIDPATREHLKRYYDGMYGKLDI